MGLGLWCRWVGMQRRGGFWLDELYSVVHATLPSWGAMWAGAGTDLHPPTYTALLRLWLLPPGPPDELRARGLSLLLAAGMLVMSTWLGSRVLGRRLALLLTLVLATSPLAVDYAVEARAYSFVLLAATALMLTLLGMVAHPTSDRWFLAAAAAALASGLSHYAGLLAAVVALGVVAVLARRGPAPIPARRLLVLGGLAVLPDALWLALTLTGLRSATSGPLWIPQPTWAELQATTSLLVGGTAMSWPALALGAFAVVARLVPWPSSLPRLLPGQVPDRLVVAALVLVPTLVLLLAFVGSNLTRYSIWSTRNMLVVLPWLCLGLAAACVTLLDVARCSRHHRRATTGAVSALVAVLVLLPVVARPPYATTEQDWRRAAREALLRTDGGTLLLSSLPGAGSYWAVYTDRLAAELAPGRPPLPADRIRPLTVDTLTADVLAGRDQVLWLGAHVPVPPQGRELLESAGFRCEQVAFVQAEILDCRRG